MKLLRCPECGVTLPAKHYEGDGTEKLRCYDCSQPGKPVYVEVIERPDRKEKSA